MPPASSSSSSSSTAPTPAAAAAAGTTTTTAAATAAAGAATGGAPTSTTTTTATTPEKILRTHPTPADPFDENVHRLLPIEEIPPPKQAMYRSKFAKEARKEYVSGMKPSASMGPAKVQVNKPDEFLRRGDRERKAPAATKYEPDRTVRKAPVPKAQPPAAAPSNKNFIKQNALENINSLAKKPNNAEPAYRFKPDYGKKPSYLVSQQQRRLAAAEAKRKEEEEEEAEDEQGGGGGGGERAPGMVVLPEAERIKVLEGLKANWAKLNNDYQKLSLTVDTVPKIARKVNMEQQLRQIESHIAKFSHKNILVNFNPAYRSTSDRLVTSLTF